MPAAPATGDDDHDDENPDDGKPGDGNPDHDLDVALAALHHDLHVPEAGHPHHRLRRWQLALLIGPIIVMVVMTNVGNALFPTLATDNPLLLITLSAVNRNLILASNQVPAPLYYVVGFLRLVAPDPFFYALGYLYGERALTFMERRTPTVGQLLRYLETGFRKGLGHVLVVIMPNNYVCLIAGAAGMSIPLFAALNVVGTIGRLVVMAWIGDTFDGAVNWILDLLRTYRWPLLALSIAIVGITLWREARLGNTQVQQLLDLEENLEEYEEGAP